MQPKLLGIDFPATYDKLLGVRLPCLFRESRRAYESPTSATVATLFCDRTRYQLNYVLVQGRGLLPATLHSRPTLYWVVRLWVHRSYYCTSS